MRQPFYDMILSGEKTIESRWSQNRIAPFDKVCIGDDILFKITGKPVSAIAKVKDVKYYVLTPNMADDIKKKYGKKIGINKFDNWESVRNKKYCTLIWLEDVKSINPLNVPRSNGAGWIVFKNE